MNHDNARFQPCCLKHLEVLAFGIYLFIYLLIYMSSLFSLWSRQVMEEIVSAQDQSNVQDKVAVLVSMVPEPPCNPLHTEARLNRGS